MKTPFRHSRFGCHWLPIRWRQIRKLVEKGRVVVYEIARNGALCDQAELDVDDVVGQPASVREAGPGQIRRLNVDSQNNIWAGIWSAGKRPGKLAKLDQTTGRFTEWTIPQQNSQPYDVAADAHDNIWFADSPMPDRAAALGKFDPRDETFTFYPKPQFSADSPKIQITRDGAVWYSPRGSRDAPAIGVLYPDMDRITTLGAYYVNGPPGYPFSVTTP